MCGFSETTGALYSSVHFNINWDAKPLPGCPSDAGYTTYKSPLPTSNGDFFGGRFILWQDFSTNLNQVFVFFCTRSNAQYQNSKSLAQNIALWSHSLPNSWIEEEAFRVLTSKPLKTFLEFLNCPTVVLEIHPCWDCLFLSDCVQTTGTLNHPPLAWERSLECPVAGIASNKRFAKPDLPAKSSSPRCCWMYYMYCWMSMSRWFIEFFPLKPM